MDPSTAAPVRAGGGPVLNPIRVTGIKPNIPRITLFLIWVLALHNSGMWRKSVVWFSQSGWLTGFLGGYVRIIAPHVHEAYRVVTPAGSAPT